MIYFDNAATTFPKPRCVLKEVDRCLRKYCGNPGRSSHRLSLMAGEEIYSVRELTAGLFHKQSPECVVFTYNATYALNLAIKSYITKNCHVLTSDIEHNSVIRPLERLKETHSVEYTRVPCEHFDCSLILPYIRTDTKGMVVSLASNVAGYYISLEELSKIARRHNLFLIVDASQAAGYFDIDLDKDPCDVLCAPGHKGLYGIQGCGFAIFSDNERKESFIEGGSGSESENRYMPILLPEGYEAGTLGTPSIVSLGRGIEYINRVGQRNIQKKLGELVSRACEVLSSFPEVTIYSPGCSLLSFNYNGLSAGLVAYELDKMGICTRPGLHCAPFVHEKLGTVDCGTVRLSFSYMNDKNELDKLYRGLKFIKKIY